VLRAQRDFLYGQDQPSLADAGVLHTWGNASLLAELAARSPRLKTVFAVQLGMESTQMIRNSHSHLLAARGKGGWDFPTAFCNLQFEGPKSS
jgi:hypothetical protein